MIRRTRSDARRLILEQDDALRKEAMGKMVELGNSWAQFNRQVVASWSKKPRFTVRAYARPDAIGVEVKAVGEHAQIWEYVDKGTGTHGPAGQPYTIRPKRPGYPLRFRGGYSARTAPVAQFNVGTGTASGAWVATYEVSHPGIAPREFEKDFQEKNADRFRRDLENAMGRAVRRARKGL